MAVLVLLISLLGGCSSEPGEEAQPPRTTEAFDNDYSIVAYVSTPSGDVSTLSFRAAEGPTETIKSPLRIKDVTLEPEGGAAVSSSMKDLARIALSECGVRRMAPLSGTITTGRTCVASQFASGVVYDRRVVNDNSVPTTAYTSAEPSCNGLDASTNAFLLFSYEPRTAAQVLQYEDSLVCAASKLVELADAEKPLTWTYGLWGLRYTAGSSVVDLPSAPSSTAESAPPVTFRVVQPKDKFLVRDLAMELLAYVPLLDQLPIKYPSSAVFKTASQHFVDATGTVPGTPLTSEIMTAAYNAPLTPLAADAAKYYPPLEVTGSSVDLVLTARRHLEMETANLRAAGQLMQDLIQKNVYAALAGAAQKAATLPPSERGKALWADGSDGNSAAEIARVLFGRLGTLGMTTGAVSQNNCATTSPATFMPGGGTWMRPEDAWKTYAPPGLLNRGDDVPRQRFLGMSADKLLAGSSFVPNATLSAADARNEVYGALRATMAASAGLTPTLFEGTPTGQILKNQVAAISDSTMRGAVSRQTATLRSLTNSASPGVNSNALTSLAYAPVPVGANGWKVNQPLTRQSYEGDIFGPLGAVQAGAECTGTGAGPGTDFTNTYNVVNGDPFNGTNSPGRPNAAGVPNTTFNPRVRSYQFQDAFAVGQALRDRLVRIREYAKGIGAPTDEDVKARAGAMFEVDGWAGGTRVVTYPDTTSTFSVVLLDVNPKDFGLSDSPSSTELVDAFGIVVEPPTAGAIATDGDLPTLAQCLSGTRKNGCSANAVNYLWKPSVGTVDATSQSAAAAQGRMRKRFTLQFSRTPATGSVPVQVNTTTRPATLNDSVLVAQMAKAVIRRAGIKGANGGQILGTTRSKGTWNVSLLDHATTFAVSPLRRKLVEAVFGFPKVNDDLNSTMADTRDYCIPGVPRDVFVPLENELTSDNDSYESSWKHYLTLAKASATKADELGRELIDIGTRIEDRKEVAADKVEAATGGPFDKDCLEEQAGTKERDFSKCGDAIKAGLAKDKLDVVLLSKDPGPTQLAATLGCATSPASIRPGICDKLATPGVTAQYVSPGTPLPSPLDAAKVYYTALGLVDPDPPPDPRIEDCGGNGSPADPYNNLEAYLAPNDGDRLRWSGSDGAVREVLKQARFTLNYDAEFKIEVNGRKLVDSSVPTDANGAWPGCLRFTGNADGCGLTTTLNRNYKVNRTLNTLFRACPGATGALGTCNATGTNTVWSELNGIRWRLMGAMWTATALGGGAPEGAFDIYIPAASFPGPVNSGAPQSGACAPTSTIYGPARFVENPVATDQWYLSGTVQGMTQTDANLMGISRAMNANFAALPASAATDMPQWYRAIYNGTSTASNPLPTSPPLCWRQGGGTTYYHVKARSAEVVSSTAPLATWLDNPGPAGMTGRGIFLGGWRALAKKAADSDPSFPAMLASVKTWFEFNSPGMAFYHDHFALEYFMLGAQWRGTDFFGEKYLNAPLGEEYPTTMRWHESGGAPPYQAPVQYDCSSADRAHWGYCAFLPGEGRPATQPPSIRARFFANSLAPMGMADAKRQLSEAAALSCVMSLMPTRASEGDAAPAISSVADLKVLDGWLEGRQALGARSVAGIFLENVPMTIVDLFNSNVVGAGKLKGQMGVVAIEATTAMRGLARSYGASAHAVSQARTEVAGLHATLMNLDAQQKVADAETHLRNIQHIANLAKSTASVIQLNPVDVLRSGIIQTIDTVEIATLTAVETFELDPAKTAVLDAQRQQALIGSSRQLAQYRKDQNDALADVRDKAGVLQAKLLILEQMKNELAGNLEKATGNGAWLCKDASGKDITCRSYVNSVLNARYSGTRVRYENALVAARAQAYYARRAVEQRLGVRLDSLENNIGPLEAPSKWADRVCNMHGVDFDSLKKEDATGDPAAKRAWAELRGREYANSFIGDYVDLLSNFVEFYNVAYPSQDGNDTLLLSMREDVERQTTACLDTSRNRLANSDELWLTTDAQTADDRQWQRHLCTGTKCVEGRSWTNTIAFTPPTPLPGVGSWLTTRAPYVSTVRPEYGIPGATGYVSQAAILPAGAYMLSFRDAALDPGSGAGTTTVTGPYRVTVFDESGTVIVTSVFTPAPGLFQAAPGPVTFPVMTARRITFTATNSGRYRIAFAPSANGVADGSVLLTDVQLERDDGKAPSGYEATNSEGLTQRTNCASKPEQLRARFQRKCDGAASTSAPARCYYESLSSFALDTQKFAVNGNSLADKAAAENFNYRHVDFAINLVGTGVRSCDENPTPACYANGTLEYDIVHEANQVGIVGYDREARRFDFGEGAIRHGKALTAERYLTLPLSGADTSLLSGTGITHTELRGRPLDGRYRLRIYESPALRWSNLEDIQLMIRYRYWSRVTSPTP